MQTIFGMCSMLATMLTTNLFILWVMPRISAGHTDQWTSHQQLVDGLSRYYSIEKDKPIVFCHQNCYLRVTYGIMVLVVGYHSIPRVTNWCRMACPSHLLRADAPGSVAFLSVPIYAMTLLRRVCFVGGTWKFWIYLDLGLVSNTQYVV